MLIFNVFRSTLLSICTLSDRLCLAPPGISVTPPQAQLSTAAGGLADDIDRFAKMRDNGILDDEEFKIVKAKTLGVSAAPGRVLLQA